MVDIRNEITYYSNEENLLSKSNALSLSKYRATDLELDIMNIAMTRIEKDYKKGKTELVARLYPTDLNQIIKKGSNIYRDLKMVSKLLTGHSIVVDTEKGFHAFAIITECKYEDYVLEITFSEHIKTHIVNLTSKYMTEDVALLTYLKGYAKRLYEILKVQAYKIKDEESIDVTYRISELKFMLGIANISEANVQKHLSKYKDEQSIDWDMLYDNVVIEKMYSDWYKFKMKVLEKAKDEINTKSDLYFDYEGVKEGHAIKKVTFSIRRNNQNPEWQQKISETNSILREKASDEYKQLEFPSVQYPELYDDMVGHNNLTQQDIDILIKTAEGNEQAVRTAIDLADKQEHILNYMGWIISCIKSGTYKTTEVMNGSVEEVEIVNEIRHDIENPQVHEKTWIMITGMEVFGDFLQYMSMTREEIEVVYENPKDRVNLFTSWRLGKI